jgi:hypothetical protein
MKKTLVFLILVASFYSSHGQDKLLDILPLKDGVVTYTNVIQVDGANKEELYSRAKKWFVTTFKSANDVIQLDDKENGEIVGKGNFNITYYARNPIINHTITISVKDGRFKYTITDLVYTDIQGDKFAIENFPKSWAGKKKLYETVDRELTQLISSIEKSMKSKADEW